MTEQNEKQAIEEMARALCRDQEGGNNHIDKCSDCVCYGICIFIQEATRAYSVGYRKQIEAEWIAKKEMYRTLSAKNYYCSNCEKNPSLIILWAFLAQRIIAPIAERT